MHPHGVVGLDELQCLGANAAAPQVIAVPQANQKEEDEGALWV